MPEISSESSVPTPARTRTGSPTGTTSEYLLEIRSQELAPSRVASLLRRLATRLFEDLMSRGLPPQELRTGATLRRVVVAVRGLPAKEKDRHVEELGPPVEEARDEDGEPTDALRGFVERLAEEQAAEQGDEKADAIGVDDLATVKTERGEYVAYLHDVEGRPIAEVLGEIVPRILEEIVRPSDRLLWQPGDGLPPWPRPVTGVLSLLDGEILPLGAEGFDGIGAGAVSVGNALLDPEPFEVESWAGYLEALEECGVVPGLKERKAALRRALDGAARDLGGTRVENDDLLDRLVALVEIPGAVGGVFDAELLTLPEELVIATLAQGAGGHGMDSFALRDEDGALLPAFVAAVDRRDDPQGRIRSGLERACAGHLADLRFHVENDRRVSLARRARRLADVTFHERLGSWAEKSERLEALVRTAVEELEKSSPEDDADDAGDGEDAENAAGEAEGGESELLAAALETVPLLKADLTTEIVREFPELRGTAGGLYARDEGFVETIWQAIYDQYRPGGVDEEIPRSRLGRLLALVDRLDSLVGFLGLGAAPTASRDPYALRRMTTGMIHILVDGGLELDLEILAARDVLLYDDRLERDAAEIVRELRALLDDRLVYFLGRRGFHFDEIEAAMAVGVGNVPDLVARLEALQALRGEEGFPALVQAAKRIANIVVDQPEHEVDPELFEADAERELYEAASAAADEVREAAAGRRYEECLRAVLELAPLLDVFFAEVLVMDEDERLRANRLGILQECRRLYWRVGRLKAMAVDPPGGRPPEGRPPEGRPPEAEANGKETR